MERKSERFVDNGDGTISDTETGLMWEKKDGPSDGVQNVENPRDVDNQYSWSAVGPRDGTAFTDFLPRLNGEIASSPANQFNGYRDWRLPTVWELLTILDSSFGAPCIDPIFGPTAVGVPGSSGSFYWSFTENPRPDLGAWAVDFTDCFADGARTPGLSEYVRAVRGGR